MGERVSQCNNVPSSELVHVRAQPARLSLRAAGFIDAEFISLDKDPV